MGGILSRSPTSDLRPLPSTLHAPTTPPPAGRPSQSRGPPPQRPPAAPSTAPGPARFREPYPTGSTRRRPRSGGAGWHRAGNSGPASASVGCRSPPVFAASRTTSPSKSSGMSGNAERTKDFTKGNETKKTNLTGVSRVSGESRTQQKKRGQNDSTEDHEGNEAVPFHNFSFQLSAFPAPASVR